MPEITQPTISAETPTTTSAEAVTPAAEAETRRRAEKLLEHLLQHHYQYHAQKESTAHGVLALEILIAGAIVSRDPWPPTWITERHIGALLGIAWLMFHLFLRFTLQKRRWAALRYAAMLSLARKWVQAAPTRNDLAAASRPTLLQSKTIRQKILWVLDFVLPVPRRFHPFDLAEGELPQCFLVAIREQERIGTGTLFPELIISAASWFVLFVILFKLF